MSFIELFKSHLASILALCGLMVAIALITTITLTTPYLTDSGGLPTTLHTAMVVTVTTLATIFSTLLASRLRHLLLQNLDGKLRQSVIISSSATVSSNDTPKTLCDLSRLDRMWRGILGIDNVAEKARNLPVGLVFLCCALNTAAIVTTFTPVSAVRSLRYHPLIPDANYAANGSCAYMIDEPVSDNQLRPYAWKLPNGSHFFVPANAGDCPTRFAEILSGSINSASPQKFAYADQGVAVQSEAIGAPVSIYSAQPGVNPALENLLKSYGTSLLNTTQCVPVMHKNPVQCRPGGTLTLGGNLSVDQNNQVMASSADGSCSLNWPFLFYNVATSNLMLNFFCPAITGNSTIGKGTMVLSGVNAYAYWLSSFINDPTVNRNGSQLPSEYKYVVTCDVDASDVFSYRRVTLNLQGSESSDPNNTDISFARVLSSLVEETCEPIHPTISNILFAEAASASWQLLSQNMGLDGLSDSLGQATGNWRGPPYAFPNSQNPLEDVLGLVAALVVSRVNTSGALVPAEDVVNNGEGGEIAHVQATRLGTGSWEGFLLLIPPVVTTIILVVLVVMNCQDKVMSPHRINTASGSNSRGITAGRVGDDTRPYAESMQQLMRLGSLLGQHEPLLYD